MPRGPPSSAIGAAGPAGPADHRGRDATSPASPSAADDILLLGRESAGVPDEVHDAADLRLRIPLQKGARSLNVALAAAMVLSEALRQTSGSMRSPTRRRRRCPTTPPSQQRKDEARAWFESLRDRICAAFERIEDELIGHRTASCAPGRFERKAWQREAGPGEDRGGGTMSTHARPRVREGRRQRLDRVRRVQPGVPQADPGRRAGSALLRQGISLVAHMRSPQVPAVHMNTRHIVTTRAWFGGGADLTPMVPARSRTPRPSTRALKAACDAHDAGLLPALQEMVRRVLLSCRTAASRAASAASSTTISTAATSRATSPSPAPSARPSSTSIRSSCAGT